MEERLRKKVFREELKKRNHGKSIVKAKYHQKYPDSVEREYIRLVNGYMSMERQVLLKYIPELKRIIMQGTSKVRNDAKNENEEKRKYTRYENVDNIFIQFHMLFETIRRELDAAFGLYKLDRMLYLIANLEQRFSTREWKKVVNKTLGVNLLEDYYNKDFYKDLIEKWVSDNVDLIKTVPNNSLKKMKSIVYDNYMKGETTTNIVKAIQKQYGMDKRHARMIARDQTAKLNAAITQYQQMDAGIEKYEWYDSNDRRVRDYGS